MKILSIEHIQAIIREVGVKACFKALLSALEVDFKRWDTFFKMPRIATHYPQGVIELMPISDADYYAYKYVNGHPKNPLSGKLTVAAVGMLSEVHSGYPLLMSEMTVLTALRTAATGALAACYLARESSKTLGIVGTGSQAEFQVLAFYVALGVREIYYYDIDPMAMKKFADNLTRFDLNLIPCKTVALAVEGKDIVITVTADKRRAKIIDPTWVKPGMHFSGVGGDCPGKTEFDPEILKRAKVVVEYWPQSKEEGEVQQYGIKDAPYSELWELVVKKKPGREAEDEITFFDSVGFALEDYTVLRYFYELSEQLNIGDTVSMIPKLKNPKNLFGLLC